MTKEHKELRAEIERLRKIEVAARALIFSPYPAHGSGFVMAVTGGDIYALKEALGGEGTVMVRPEFGRFNSNN